MWIFSAGIASDVLSDTMQEAVTLGFGPKGIDHKVVKIAYFIIDISTMYGFAKMLNSHGFSINGPVICFSLLPSFVLFLMP